MVHEDAIIVFDSFAWVDEPDFTRIRSGIVRTGIALHLEVM